MHANRRDANEDVIVELFEKAGGYWQPCHPDQGHDGDLYYKGYTLAIEIKDGSKPPSKRKLTRDEVIFEEEIGRRGVKLWIIESLDDAQALVEFRFKDIGKE